LQTHGAALKMGGSYVSYLRRFETLKTAAGKRIETPNNVSIDSYGFADLTSEPVVLSVPAQTDSRWTIARIGDFFTRSSTTSTAARARSRACTC
jgi:hypothetical protein